MTRVTIGQTELYLKQKRRKRVSRKFSPIVPQGKHPFRYLVEFYYQSNKFLTLSGKTQKNNTRELNKVCDTVLKDGRKVGSIRIDNLGVAHLSEAYAIWVRTVKKKGKNNGIRTANIRSECLSAVYRVAQQAGIVEKGLSPISLVDKIADKPRRVRWTHQNVKLFLDTAYGDFDYRSIGLIVHMAYEWAQRLGDMRTLTWDKLDLEAQRCDLTQRKRGAEVHLPIPPQLNKMLVLQKEDWGFQQYVAPRVKRRAGAYTPYQEEEIHAVVNEVKEIAGLPSDITGQDLRRTAITQMVEAGADQFEIMQVSGHTSPNSVTPYLVNTLTGATNALAKRWSNKDE